MLTGQAFQHGIELLEFFGELPLLLHQILIMIDQRRGWIDEDLAEEAIDDQRPAVDAEQRQIDERRLPFVLDAELQRVSSRSPDDIVTHNGSGLPLPEGQGAIAG